MGLCRGYSMNPSLPLITTNCQVVSGDQGFGSVLENVGDPVWAWVEL